ncbi:hypothetical protein OQJ26_08485 [Legionella sp. PATHC038]|uniref:hypothetical protein n=1 Tax=Legionella sheltonii TaxID=2992041 RepID=UPI002244573E|nr:hypothetical protein [Legionella sp. PATHC038]MCW8398827.1 hypothetical protein [Legionella sp. PATHC038]
MTNKDIAGKAVKYAREIILEGTTQPANNMYSDIRKKAISEVMFEFRILAMRDPKFSLEFDSNAQQFYQRIQLCKKFSVGNCYEYALLALDYVINHEPHVSAEVFYIKGGDHCFLVIGRKAGSNPLDPTTWGEEAYICDPSENEAYPAVKYLSRLKNYYKVDDNNGETFTNFSENFNKDKHRLAPIPNLNTDYFRNYNSEEHLSKLFMRFREKYAVILSVAEKMKHDFERIAGRLVLKYGSTDAKFLILSSQLAHLTSLIEDMKNGLIAPYVRESYGEMKAKLDEKLICAINVLDEITKDINKENLTLAKYNNESSWRTSCMKFFNILPQTVRKTQTTLETSQDQCQRIKAELKIIY